MDAYGLWETVEPRALGEQIDPSKSKQALAFLFQAIPEDMMLQMTSYIDPKQVWDGLKTRFLGMERVRSARLATLKRELEGLRMKEVKTVDDFAEKMIELASTARPLGYEIEEANLVKKLLDSMPKSFLRLVASIEQCFELDVMLFDNVVGRLGAYEERTKGLEMMEDIQGGLLLASEEKFQVGLTSDVAGGRGHGSGRSQDDNERVRYKSHVTCYKCGELGHYIYEFSKCSGKSKKHI